MEDQLFLNPIFPEILDLLISYHFFLKASKKIAEEDPGGFEGFEQMHHIRLLHNDIVLRLCKLGDKAKHTWNFEQVLKVKQAGQASSTAIKALKDKIGEYLVSIENLQNNQRHNSIAHIAKKRTSIVGEYDFKKSIGLALEISDLLQGEHNFFQIPFANPPIDLRKDLGFL